MDGLKHPVTGKFLPQLRQLFSEDVERGISYWPIGAPEIIRSNFTGRSTDPEVQQAHLLWTYVRGAELGAVAFVRGEYLMLESLSAPVQFYRER